MTRTFTLLPGVVLLAAFIGLMPQAGAAATVTVTMRDNTYAPQNITINAGDSVVWVNSGSMAHTATADNGAFDTGTINPGSQAVATFPSAGTYPYHCKFHGGAGGVGMAGLIIVSGASASAYTPVTSAPVTPNNSAQISAQAQALLTQVTALQAQLNTLQGSTATGTYADASSCPQIGRTLKLGVSGDDVMRLQRFLARDPSIYPERLTSGYFGALTQAAVERWQTKYNIVSSGSAATTGYGQVGPRTAAAMALSCAQGGGGVVGAAPNVGGYISVTPITGNAPLQVAVTATINTTNSCAAAVYTLDFGDGSVAQQVPLASGVCGPQSLNFPHVYQYGGTYKVTLAAGGHQTNATVTVAGNPPPVFTQGLPAESFQATPTTGSMPLAVTFSGVVNSNDRGFCQGGCASILDFGDGTSAQVALPATVGGWLNYSVQHTYNQSGGFKATIYQGGAGANQPTIGTATIIVNQASVATTTGTGTYNYSPFVVSVSGSALSFAAQFDLPSSCTGYDLSWGDGTAHEIQNDGGSSCAQTAVVHTSSHTYASGGTYTITLKRGPTLSRTDDVQLTIAN